ncbi:histidine kinase [Virgisporangium aliadipatigenens]|uniref:histidine kinase n=1 Tax=Virgisporangium aliadipatigenens TaxID=741659 RepID=A0A8J3YJH3_9ACTN|nr:sensor histidine kinase [Virgisporangium aliadipatigenens]GIJ45527.1 histidine kinase [Virgisporangium aliadipatigenens]
MDRTAAARATGWLLTGVPVGALLSVGLPLLVAFGIVGLPVLVGVPVLIGAPLVGVPVAAVERRRLRLLGVALADPHRDPGRPGLSAWVTCRYREPATWRDLGHALVTAVLWPLDLLVLVCALGTPLTLLTAPLVEARYGEVKLLKAVLVEDPLLAWAAVPLGLLALAAAGYALVAYARVRVLPAEALLRPRAGGARDVIESRARLVDAFDAERRRIERDLHDGAQQRLVALGLTLGLARVADPAELPELVTKAHEEAGRALAELQELIHGIHPRILTDRGLPAALAELADRSPVPVDVRVALPRRLPGPVEAGAYFVVAEALTNVARHAGATRAAVDGRLDGHRLVVEVRDDGRGGADPAAGSGLTGLADRVAVLDGTLTLDSPPGGPTSLRVEIPCG